MFKKRVHQVVIDTSPLRKIRVKLRETEQSLILFQYVFMYHNFNFVDNFSVRKNETVQKHYRPADLSGEGAWCKTTNKIIEQNSDKKCYEFSHSLLFDTSIWDRI